MNQQNSEAHGYTIIRLRTWFGEKEFKIADLNDTQIEEIAELLNIRPPELRAKVGRRLSNKRLSSHHGNQTLSLSVKARADGTQAAIYQIKEIGSR